MVQYCSPKVRSRVARRINDISKTNLSLSCFPASLFRLVKADALIAVVPADRIWHDREGSTVGLKVFSQCFNANLEPQGKICLFVALTSGELFSATAESDSATVMSVRLLVRLLCSVGEVERSSRVTRNAC
jgi:hypothetical protein